MNQDFEFLTINERAKVVKSQNKIAEIVALERLVCNEIRLTNFDPEIEHDLMTI